MISFFMRAISFRISERISPSSSFFSSWRSSRVTTTAAAPGATRSALAALAFPAVAPVAPSAAAPVADAGAEADADAMFVSDAEAPPRCSCVAMAAASAPSAVPFFDAAISAGFL